MLSTLAHIKKKKVKRVKTPTHILLFADSKQEAVKLLQAQNKTLSAFLQEKVEELVKDAKKKEMVYMQCPKYKNVIPLESNLDPYNYDYPPIADSDPNAEADVSLSFSHRLRLNIGAV